MYRTQRTSKAVPVLLAITAALALLPPRAHAWFGELCKTKSQITPLAESEDAKRRLLHGRPTKRKPKPPTAREEVLEMLRQWHEGRRRDDELAEREEARRIAREIRTEPRNGPVLVNDPVASATGEYTTEAVDLFLGGPLPLAFARQYSTFLGQSASAWGFYQGAKAPMGVNWIHNFQEILLKVSDTKVAIYGERGSVVIFDYVTDAARAARAGGTRPGAYAVTARGAGGSWVMVPPPVGFIYMGIPYQLVENGTKLELMDPDRQHIYTFEFASLADFETSNVEMIRDRNANTHALTYNPDGTLAHVADDFGRSLSFEYLSSGLAQRVRRVTDHAGRSVELGYLGFSLKTVKNPRGKTTAFEHDTGARITSVTMPVGNVVLQNSYYADSRVFAQVDGVGNTTTLAYDASSTTITDALGNTRTHHFDAFGRMTSLADEAGNTIDHAYDGLQRFIGRTDRMGDANAVSYSDESGYVTSRTDNQGNVWTYVYTPQEQEGFTFYDLTDIVYPSGAVTSIQYDANGNVVALTDREGNTWTYTRNARGQVLTMTNPEGGVTTYTYNADATVATMQDPSGNVTTYAYDTVKRPVFATFADGSTAQTAYDENDNLVSFTDGNGNTTFYFYDDNDNLLGITDPLGNQTVFAYDGNDDLVSVTDDLGRTTSYTYDPLRRRASVTRPSGATTTFAYDARRRLSAITNEAGGTRTFVYDAEGVPASMSDESGDVWTFASDALGRITSVQDPLGNTSSVGYDAIGDVVQLTDASSQSSDLDRDANQDVEQIVLAEPDVSASYLRSSLRRVENTTDPRGFDWSSTYDAHGRRTDRSDPLDNASSFAYDDRNRLVHVALPGGLGTLDVAYDDAGRIVQRAYSDGTAIAYAYDAHDRLTSTAGASFAYDAADQIVDCNGLAMTYDADGNLETLTLAPGKVVTYTYDARRLPVTVTDWVGGQTTLTYDADGRLVSLTRPNGATTTYAYDAAGRLVGIDEDGDLASTMLTRDERGLTVAATRDMPLEATPEELQRSITHDPANQLLDATHDAMGRLLADGARTFTWDLASRAIGIDDGSGVVMFTHDGFDHVVTRTEAGATRTHVWNYALALPSISVVREGAARGSSDLRYHVHTPDGLLLHTIDAADDTRLYYHFDEVGSTRFITDESGVVTDAYAYSPHGELLASSGPSDNSFTFHGRYGVVAEGDLYLMRARFYDPSLGRFVSRDKLELIDPVSVNPYQALAGNPLMFVDPMGTDEFPADPDVGSSDSPSRRERSRKLRNRIRTIPANPLLPLFLALSGPDGPFTYLSHEELKERVTHNYLDDPDDDDVTVGGPDLGATTPGNERQAENDEEPTCPGIKGEESGVDEEVL